MDLKTTTMAFFACLSKNFPAPWKLEYHKMNPHYFRQHVSCVVAANGECPLTLETYSGDGDRFNLGGEGAEALVKFMNYIHAAGLTDIPHEGVWRCTADDGKEKEWDSTTALDALIDAEQAIADGALNVMIQRISP